MKFNQQLPFQCIENAVKNALRDGYRLKKILRNLAQKRFVLQVKWVA